MGLLIQGLIQGIAIAFTMVYLFYLSVSVEGLEERIRQLEDNAAEDFN